MESERPAIIRARDVMRKGIVLIDGMATVKDAVNKMRSEKVASLLVEKRNADDAWGILVIQDMIKGTAMVNRLPEDVHVYEIMTKPVITAPADMDIRYVIHLIVRAGMRQAPVEENGELIGMISLSSLILENDFILGFAQQ